MVFFVSLAVDNAMYLHRLYLMLVSFFISAFIHTKPRKLVLSSTIRFLALFLWLPYA